jgi:predicted metalloprotease
MKLKKLRRRAGGGDVVDRRAEGPLQADCLAGVWGRSAQAAGILQPGDIEEGLHAASRIGDDVLMKEAGVSVNPDAFTHGTAEQRATWLRTGIQVGNPDACDTFNNDF